MLINKSNKGYSFTNFEQINRVVEVGVREALTKATDIAIDKLIEFIDEGVYGEPQGWYKRTEDLKKKANWDGRVFKGLNGYTLEIYFTGDVFSHNALELQHSSFSDRDENDIDPLALIGILNGNGGLSLETNLSRWGIKHEAFWDKFEWWFHDNFTALFKECLALPIKE